MLQRRFMSLVARAAILLFCLASVLYPAGAQTQTTESVAEQKQKVLDLVKQTKYTQALPLLEKLSPPNRTMLRCSSFSGSR